MAEVTGILKEIGKRAEAFRDEANRILGKHEASKERVITVDLTLKKLSGLSIHQDELFQDALKCVERDINRAAIVMAWAGFIDFLQEKLASDGFVKVHSARPKWSKWKTIEELRDNVNEYQQIETARSVGLLSKTAMKALHGLLSKRNECAHPSDYKPDMNESLGYISEMLNRIVQLQKKTL